MPICKVERLKEYKGRRVTQHSQLKYRSKRNLPYKTERREIHGAVGVHRTWNRTEKRVINHAMMKKMNDQAPKVTAKVPLYNQG